MFEREAYGVTGHLDICDCENVVVVVRGVGEGSELVTLLENLVAGHDVDCKRGDDADPRVSSVVVHVFGAGFVLFAYHAGP